MPSTLSLYDGRDLVGVVLDHGDGCEAFLATGARLGSFKDRKAAIAAINSALECSCVGRVRRGDQSVEQNERFR
jgi:hypothetical protein